MDTSSSTGVVRVDGAGSKWTIGYILYLGQYGNGTLIVTNGGAVRTVGSQHPCYFGFYTGSTGVATVDGAGSMWTGVGGFTVGYSGNGTLNITNGGCVSGSGSIGDRPGSTGVANVDGAGSMWSITGVDLGGGVILGGQLYVGYSGTGTLNISNGGTVICNSIGVGYSSGSVGTINFDGGILKSCNAGNTNWISKGAGTTNVYVKEGGALFDTGGYDMGIGIPLQHGGSNPIDGGVTKLGAGTLTLSGANTYTGPTTVKAGTLELESGRPEPGAHRRRGQYPGRKPCVRLLRV